MKAGVSGHDIGLFLEFKGTTFHLNGFFEFLGSQTHQRLIHQWPQSLGWLQRWRCWRQKHQLQALRAR